MTDLISEPRMRNDTRRNRSGLLKAVGEAVRESPGELSMQNMAARAEIATATAYRYFSSIDDLLSAYVLNVVGELKAYSATSTKRGAELFDDVLAEWIRLIAEHGPVLVQLRSRSGFLKRLQAEDPVITTVVSAWDKPLRAVLKNWRIPDRFLPEAIFLLNVLIDPREVLDLQSSRQLSAETIQQKLTAALMGAVQGWVGSKE